MMLHIQLYASYVFIIGNLQNKETKAIFAILFPLVSKDKENRVRVEQGSCWLITKARGSNPPAT